MILPDEYKIKYINKFLDVSEIGIEKRDGNINCIFHSDSKASARVYSDNSFWCFTCNRFFYPINIIRREHLNIDIIFEDLFKRYGYQEIDVAKEKEIRSISTKGKDIIQFSKEFFNI
jgi:hypothetical protein